MCVCVCVCVCLSLSLLLSLSLTYTHTHADGKKAMDKQVIVTVGRKVMYADGTELTAADIDELGGPDKIHVSTLISFLQLLNY